MTASTLEQAYGHCQRVVRDHYENFPVASRLLPRAMRRPVTVIYAFARQADDLADEGDALPETRLRQLDLMAQKLDVCGHSEAHADPVFQALADVLQRHPLPEAALHDLLRAFRQDVVTDRYTSFDDLLAYCRLSANPIGRLMLALAGRDTPANCELSDRICTALQLINLLQDMAEDYQKRGRIYLPQEEMRAVGVSERHIAEQISDPPMRLLFSRQIARARSLLRAGAPLPRKLNGMLAFEIRLVVQAGLRVLERLDATPHPFANARLGRRDRLLILARSLGYL